MHRRDVLRAAALTGGAALSGCVGVGGLARQGPPEYLEWCLSPEPPWQEYAVVVESPATVLDHRRTLRDSTTRGASGRYRRTLREPFGLQPGTVEWTATAGLRFQSGPELTVVAGEFDHEDVVWTVETDPLLGYTRAGSVRGAPLYLADPTHGIVVTDGHVVVAEGGDPEGALREAFAVRAGERDGLLAASRDARRLAAAFRDATWSSMTVTTRSRGLGWRSWGYGFELRGTRTRAVEALTLVDSTINVPETDPREWERYRTVDDDLRNVRVSRTGTLVVAQGWMDTDEVRFGVSPFSPVA